MAVINTPFLVTGGETNRPPTNAFSLSQRQMNIRAPILRKAGRRLNYLYFHKIS
ncbi:MAG: hypothetical protein JGK38_12030 [Microcoleus sp. PH2017_15_JOR_U_A]|uniref:hypothetical protein n=1 Tax=unclassified Microcoleus TaxID=2642155 RepID=UPI001E12D3F3|nr:MULTISPECIES: hypothetical protein [unclassified Microcoleus]MCC3472660.1 hypothetical protein [Microcoleus sp. PH2017_13_LAR_U_A]MCC3485112.1 hypothetical protein [Microcoleus sp. PH2017_14_LAR_D_A]MCC3497350.1 hypothetical protein [Microcoleus sp. PH2017_15_JOR_U_A]MCC3597807.1 hypothetical protein [Microcoleus sp. PH2017_26_ELK_O_A]MCC3622787.1 hypothetical protein [Microcoleus sp. PH2017_36_ELK_O_B]